MKTKIKFVKDSKDFSIKAGTEGFIDGYGMFGDFCGAIIFVEGYDYPVISWIRDMEFIILR